MTEVFTGYKVGDLVKVKVSGSWQKAVIIKYGRNQCYVTMGVEPEYYADLETLSGESRWVKTIDMKPLKKKS
jgi:ribosomal protein L21E